jgi:YfiH family protein
MNYRFTNRTGGASTGAFASANLGFHVGDNPEQVAQNRAQLFEEFGPVAFMTQVHGDRVAVVEDLSDVDPTADALVTGILGITLAVQVADCIPLLLIASQSVAAVHVGRKGLVNGVTLRALEVMRDMGASDIRAVAGPAICGVCYEVSAEIFTEVTALHPAAASKSVRGNLALDLPSALVKVLEGQNIEVEIVGGCTVENSELFSYRRDGVTGRQAGLVWL